MRSGTLLHGLVLLAPVSPLVAVGLDRRARRHLGSDHRGGLDRRHRAGARPRADPPRQPALPGAQPGRDRQALVAAGRRARRRARRRGERPLAPAPRSGCSPCSPRWPVWPRSPTWSSGPAGSARTHRCRCSSAGRSSSGSWPRPAPVGGCGYGRRHRCRTSTATRPWTTLAVNHPAGVSAGWSVVYGLLYGLLALVTFAWTPQQLQPLDRPRGRQRRDRGRAVHGGAVLVPRPRPPGDEPADLHRRRPAGPARRTE